jgi:hypothetical protein
MNKEKFIIMFSLLFAATYCKKELVEGQKELGPYTISPATKSINFNEASLVVAKPDTELFEPGDFTLKFQVTNFELGAKTTDYESKKIANSVKGQHIHLITNNGPYKALYEASITQPFSEGEHVVLAFLSRSYHESVKSQSTHTLRVFRSSGTPTQFDMNGQHLFYSRPKGTYSLAEAKNIMVDFYLINTKLSDEGNSVELTLNGHKTRLYAWEPVIISGLPKGKHKVSLRLLNKRGQLIDGPFNEVTRTFTIIE